MTLNAWFISAVTLSCGASDFKMLDRRGTTVWETNKRESILHIHYYNIDKELEKGR